MTVWARHLMNMMIEVGNPFDRVKGVREKDISEYVTWSESYMEKRVRELMLKGFNEQEAWKESGHIETADAVRSVGDEETFWKAYV